MIRREEKVVKKQAYNPYLPSYEYLPDGEPYVFGDRVYVYGSHDRFDAPIFCMNDYVCWSAPVEDLSDWRYEGVIYRKNQDPMNRFGIRLLFAPDVAQGKDGRFYLYYAIDFLGVMSVAVCDSPAGEYQFYGHIHDKDGTIWGRRKGDQMSFDPGVLVDEDGSVYLYSGFYKEIPAIVTGRRKLRCDGGVVLKLDSDMLTIQKKPTLLFPKKGKDSFPNHEFFEASSIRKMDGKYYFVYSSRHNHELCYAVSDFPDREFKFGGTLVSLGDLFLDGNREESKGVNYLGNTHGGMVEILGQWYIFYHRHTNRHSYSRQACAEKLNRRPDGGFAQSEVTSCGLNPGPLKGIGNYEARIACNLWTKYGVGRYDVAFPRKKYALHPYFTQSGKDRNHNPDQYIANMRGGAVAGFKYFEFDHPRTLTVKIRGKAKGDILLSDRSDFKSVIATISVTLSDRRQWVEYEGLLAERKGVIPLYFRFIGQGYLDFYSFELS